jgi:TolB-like protein
VADAGDPALELGVADSLILELGAVGALSVRPLSAVRRFHDPATDPLAAGRALRVDAVLDGHLQRVEDRIRVSVRLLRVVDGQQLWADQFDERLTGIFAVQDAISKRVVTALALQLDAHARSRLARHSTTSAQAYEHYLRGRFHLSLGQPRQAIACSRRRSRSTRTMPPPMPALPTSSAGCRSPPTSPAARRWSARAAKRCARLSWTRSWPARTRCWAGSASTTTGTGRRARPTTGARWRSTARISPRAWAMPTCCRTPAARPRRCNRWTTRSRSIRIRRWPAP